MADVQMFVPILIVDDLERAIEFYVDVLGYTESFRWGEPPYYAGVNGADNAHLHLNTKGTPGQGELYVMVGDVDAAYAAVQQKGATVEVELQDQEYGMRDFAVRDPAGNLISIGTPLPQSEG